MITTKPVTLHAVKETGCLHEQSEGGEPKACLPIKNALEGYSITIQSLYTVYCDQAPGVCVCAFTSFCVNKKIHNILYSLISEQG